MRDECFVVTLGERQITVEVRKSDSGFEVALDGRPRHVDSRRIAGSFVHHLLIEGRSYEANVRFDGDRALVHIGGVRFDLRVEDELRARAGHAEEGRSRGEGEEVLAPMPGTVVSIHAGIGDRIAPGGRIAVVEAMKMQNELDATHGGVVSSIHVRPGQTVDAGQILVTLRPDPDESA